MARGAWVLSLVAALAGCRDRSPPPSETAAPPTTIVCRTPVVGDRWRIVKTTTTTTRNDHPGGTTSVRMENDEEHTERVLAVEAGVVTRLEVTFAAHTRRTITRDGPDVRTVSPVVGKTYLFATDPAGGVVITEAGLPVRPEELTDLQLVQAELGRLSPPSPALCDRSFRPGDALVDETGAQQGARKRTAAQSGEGVEVGEFTMRYARKDRGAALFTASTRVTAPTGSSELRYDAWVRPSDGAFTRTETQTKSSFSSGSATIQASVTMEAFVVETRDGPLGTAP